MTVDDFEIDHIFPQSTLHPGLGLNHVANYYLMSRAENGFFGARPDLHHIKLNCIGDVRICYLFVIGCTCNVCGVVSVISQSVVVSDGSTASPASQSCLH